MATLHLDKAFAQAMQGSNPYDYLLALEGKIFRDVKGRITKQFKLKGKSYFVKIHSGVGWAEIFKNLSQLRMPILGARNEWQAIERLGELGVDTMTVVAYGEKGWNPARRRSFIVTEDLIETESLEDICKPWSQKSSDLPLKRILIEKLAEVSRKLHSHGICHRDYYICHFLLHSQSDGEAAVKVSLIDLHRALIKDTLTQRWIIKDVAGLYFSAMEIGLSQRDLFRFMRIYSDKGLRHCLEEDAKFWRAVQARALNMYQKLGPAN